MKFHCQSTDLMRMLDVTAKAQFFEHSSLRLDYLIFPIDVILVQNQRGDVSGRDTRCKFSETVGSSQESCMIVRTLWVLLPGQKGAKWGDNDFSNVLCSAIIMWSIFPKSSQKIHHSSPVRASYGVSFVESICDLYSALVTAGMHVIYMYC